MVEMEIPRIILLNGQSSNTTQNAGSNVQDKSTRLVRKLILPRVTQGRPFHLRASRVVPKIQVRTWQRAHPDLIDVHWHQAKAFGEIMKATTQTRGVEGDTGQLLKKNPSGNQSSRCIAEAAKLATESLISLFFLAAVTITPWLLLLLTRLLLSLQYSS